MDFLIDTISHVLQISPLIIGHLIIPPLSYLSYEIPPAEVAGIFEFIYSYVTPTEVKSWSWMKSHLLISNDSDQDFKRYFWHLFIHGDYDHLMGNMLSMIFSSDKCLRYTNIAWVYAIFIGGGVVSAIPSPFWSKQTNLLFNELFKVAKDFTENWYFSSSISGIFSRGLVMIVQPRYLCGSSGAISALNGFSFALIINEGIDTWSSKACIKSSNCAQNKGNQMLNCWRKYLLRNLLPISTTLIFWGNEIFSLFGTHDKKSLGSIVFGEKIGHAAHLQGAAFGLIVGTVFTMFKKPKKTIYM